MAHSKQASRTTATCPWIANDKPLWVRFEGRNYFPVVKFYPEDVFAKNGRLTRPDYKALAASAAFAPDSANWMVWPLIRSGPLESARPEDIQLPDTVTVTAMPQTRVDWAGLWASKCWRAWRIIRLGRCMMPPVICWFMPRW